MSNVQTYPLADPVALVLKIKAAGGPQLDPTQPTGEATADGVTLGWSIADGKITITILKHSWLAQPSLIWSHVNKLLGDPL